MGSSTMEKGWRCMLGQVEKRGLAEDPMVVGRTRSTRSLGKPGARLRRGFGVQARGRGQQRSSNTRTCLANIQRLE